MSDLKAYFTKKISGAQGSEEEKACAAILFNDLDIVMGDQRLNHLAALTYNHKPCQDIFSQIEKAISPIDNHWKTIYKALLLLHTIILYGSELAIDKSVDLCKYVHPLQTYNSALVKKGFFSSGGTDYGAPVRATATTVTTILMRDDNIRKARQEARAAANTLVPMGTLAELTNPSRGMEMSFGQGLTTSVGAGFTLEDVPGMYANRPDRYFDNANDPRSRTIAGNSQVTRDAMAPSLLDLVFDSPAVTTSNLPQADYLPAMQRQRELERQLQEQQELLRRLQEQQQQQQLMQQQQQYSQQPQPYAQPGMGGGAMYPSTQPQQPQQLGAAYGMGSYPMSSQPQAMAPRPAGGMDLLGLDWSASPSPAVPAAPSFPSSHGMGLPVRMATGHPIQPMAQGPSYPGMDMGMGLPPGGVARAPPAMASQPYGMSAMNVLPVMDYTAHMGGPSGAGYTASTPPPPPPMPPMSPTLGHSHDMPAMPPPPPPSGPPSFF